VSARPRTRRSLPDAKSHPTENEPDWWPNQLDLQVLQQHSPRATPLGKSFDYAKELASLDVEALKTTSGN